MLGLYDSGLGGLTVLAALRRAGVNQDVVYFADQGHAPYGDKTDAEIHGYLSANLAVLEELGVDAVVTACNTTCAVGQRLGWPAVRFEVLDLISNAGSAFRGTAYRSVAVVATAATVRSGAYARAIRSAARGVDVVEIAAPALVPIVERGDAESPAAREAVAAVVAQIPTGIDAIVYGCTHYPLLDRWFAAALPPGVARLDPAEAQAVAAAQLVEEQRLPPGRNRTSYFTSGDVAAFDAAVRRWTGKAHVDVASFATRRSA